MIGTVTTHRTDSAEGFERLFREKVLAKWDPTDVKPRLLVVIDNLDRVGHDKAVEALTTIKTFLEAEKSKVVYLIPCDDEAIKRHLRKAYLFDEWRDHVPTPAESLDTVRVSEDSNSGENDDGESLPQAGASSDRGRAQEFPDEFLRKFFNVSLRIPEFFGQDLYAFTEAQLRATGLQALLADDGDAVLVIAAAFRDNPRQIKQFVNLFVARYLLAQAREQRKLISENGLVTSNPAFLAKIIVLQNQFDLHRPSEVDGALDREQTMDGSLDEEVTLDSFLRTTKHITRGATKLFLYLKQPDDELAYERVDELRRLLEENNAEGLSGLLQADSSHIRVIQKLILSFMEQETVSVKFNVVDTALRADYAAGGIFQPAFYKRIGAILANGSLASKLQKFAPDVIFSTVLQKCKSAERQRIIERYLDLLQDPGEPDAQAQLTATDAFKVFKNLKEKVSWLIGGAKQKVRTLITETYFANESVLELFSDEKSMRVFISDQAVANLINTLRPDEFEEPESSRLSFVSLFTSVGESASAEAVVRASIQVFHGEISKSMRPEKQLVVEQVTKLIEHFKDVVERNLTDSAESQLNELAGIALETQAQVPEHERGFFLPLLMWLRARAEDSADQIDVTISESLRNSNHQGINLAIKAMGDKPARALVQAHFPEVIKVRAQADAEVFGLTYPLASREQKDNWLIGLISSDDPSQPERGLNQLESDIDRIRDKRGIVSALLTAAEQAGLENLRPRVYGAINQLRCAEDPGLTNQFETQVVALLTRKDVHGDAEQKNVGYDAWRNADYISAPKRGAVAQALIKWVRADDTPPYQPHAIRAVLLDWAQVADMHQRDFIETVFEKSLETADSPESVRLGFEVLMHESIRRRITYGQQRNHLERVWAHYQNADQVEIKQELLNGLRSVAPANPRGAGAEFWRAVKRHEGEPE